IKPPTPLSLTTCGTSVGGSAESTSVSVGVALCGVKGLSLAETRHSGLRNFPAYVLGHLLSVCVKLVSYLTGILYI
ncbi:MAG: hypothetical protein ACPHQD_18350, partial [Vibrio toranzoniae]|uniref:hypothetical protein n=1 Tax=Vibrio toranzoniae TaxID=1194427 RepID=UPI003C63673A